MTDGESWLEMFKGYFGEVADFAANPVNDTEKVMALAARTNMIYSLSFYAENMPMLYPHVLRLFDQLGKGETPDFSTLEAAVKNVDTQTVGG